MKTLDEVEKEIQKLLAENNLKIGYDIYFPNYAQLPEDLKRALNTLYDHGMKIVFTLETKQE